MEEGRAGGGGRGKKLGGTGRSGIKWEGGRSEEVGVGSVLRGKKGKSGDNTLDNSFEDLCEENSSLTECGIEREFCLCVF